MRRNITNVRPSDMNNCNCGNQEEQKLIEVNVANQYQTMSLSACLHIYIRMGCMPTFGQDRLANVRQEDGVLSNSIALLQGERRLQGKDTTPTSIFRLSFGSASRLIVYKILQDAVFMQNLH